VKSKKEVIGTVFKPASPVRGRCSPGPDAQRKAGTTKPKPSARIRKTDRKGAGRNVFSLNARVTE